MNYDAQINSRINQQIIKSMRKLMESKDFRFIMAHLMLDAGLEKGYTPSQDLAYCEGRRSVALQIASYFDAIPLGSDTLYGTKVRQLAVCEHKETELHLRDLIEREEHNNGRN